MGLATAYGPFRPGQCVHDIFRSRVIFLVPIFCWKAEGDVSPGFGAGVAGLGGCSCGTPPAASLDQCVYQGFPMQATKNDDTTPHIYSVLR